MITVIQLTAFADVKVNGAQIGAIQKGIMALIGIEKTDTELHAQKLFEKIMTYRIFPDAEGKTNLNLQQVDGGLLLVPQFTLVADTKSGTRPGFSRGMPPAQGAALFAYLVEYAKQQYQHVACGEFGINMQVTLCNDGPMTFILNV